MNAYVVAKRPLLGEYQPTRNFASLLAMEVYGELLDELDDRVVPRHEFAPRAYDHRAGSSQPLELLDDESDDTESNSSIAYQPI